MSKNKKLHLPSNKNKNFKIAKIKKIIYWQLVDKIEYNC